MKMPDMTKSLAVVITAHAPYLQYVAAAVAGWEAQGHFLSEKVLVLDACEPTTAVDLPAGWRLVRTAWANANAARNTAVAGIAAEWIIHWDADNVPPANYALCAARAVAKAGRRVGVLAPLVKTDAHERVLNEAVLHGADARTHFVVDTASVWRRQAMLHAGAWDILSTRYDDWTLAKNMVACGWTIQALPEVVIVQHEHEQRMSHTNSAAMSLWRTRRVGIVALLSGRMDVTQKWIHALKTLELPPRVGLTVMVPETRPGLRRLLWDGLAERLESFERVTFTVASERRVLSLVEKHKAFRNLHRVVGGLYARDIEATPEEVILTWEDDVFPEKKDALAVLLEGLHPNNNVAAVAGAYPSRHNAELVCAGFTKGSWAGVPKWADLPNERVEVGNLAGGFTVWQRAALEACPILGPEMADNGTQMGWDGAVCRALLEDKWRLMLDGRVRCAHEATPRKGGTGL